MSPIRPTLVTLVVFGALCIGASFVPLPGGDGTLLSVAPRWPWDQPPEPEPVEVQHPVRAVVDLPPAPAPLPPPPEHVDDGSDEGSGATAPVARGPDPADIALRDAMAALAAQLGAPAAPLERPCIEYDADGACVRRAMDRFFDELRSTALRQRPLPVRISWYGDSLVLGDDLCHGLRTRMQEQFGDGGHGFVHMAHPDRIAGALGIHVRYDGAWDVATIVTGGGAGRYGLAGAVFRPDDGGSVLIRSVDEAGPGDAFDRVGVLWRRGHEGESYRLRVDGERLDTARSDRGNVLDWYELADGPHRLALDRFRGGEWYGVLIERSGPGVVVDNLGMVNGSTGALARIDEDHWAEHLRLRGVDLGTFLYGVNRVTERAASDDRVAEWTTEYAEILTRFRRARPESDCLVAGLLTRGGWDDGSVFTWRGVEGMVRAQRAAAQQAGCAFFDTHAAIGGAEGTRAWYTARPMLLGPDLSHPTRQGYDVLSGLMYDAMIHAFAEYLDERVSTAR